LRLYNAEVREPLAARSGLLLLGTRGKWKFEKSTRSEDGELMIFWKNVKQIIDYQIQAFKSRPGRLYALLAAPRAGVCAEIGVWAGGFSRRIVQLRKPSELHLIDPWQFVPSLPERMYGGSVASSQSYMDNLMASVVERFASNPSVKIHRSTSLEAVRHFHDCYFDWIYLDGDHSYEAVLADLNAWFPKVKIGGLIVCDDYTWVDESRTRSVKNAVHAFLDSHPDHKGQLFLGQFLIRKMYVGN
jgi:hypothetical protein